MGAVQAARKTRAAKQPSASGDALLAVGGPMKRVKPSPRKLLIKDEAYTKIIEVLRECAKLSHYGPFLCAEKARELLRELGEHS